MPTEIRTDRAAATSAVHSLPWISQSAFAQQAIAALTRNYAAGPDAAYLASLSRRPDALRRWRGQTSDGEAF